MEPLLGQPAAGDATREIGPPRCRAHAAALLFLAAGAPPTKQLRRRGRRGHSSLKKPPCTGPRGNCAVAGAGRRRAEAFLVLRAASGRGQDRKLATSRRQDDGPDGSGDAHLRRYGGRLLGGAGETEEVTEKEEQELATERLIYSMTIFDGIAEGGLYLPAFYILKDDFHLSPVDVSLSMGALMLPWVTKPFVALLSDQTPIAGRRRTPYLKLGVLIIGGTYLGVWAARSYVGTLAIFALNTFGRVLLSAVLQGMVVELARPHGPAGTSERVGDFFLYKTGGALVSTMMSSVLIDKVGPRTTLAVASLLPMALLLYTAHYESQVPPDALLDEEVAGEAEQDSGAMGVSNEHWQQIKVALANPAVWSPLAFLMAYNAGPNYDDPLYYFYINKLGFRPTAVGRLKMAQELAKLIGTASYRYGLRDIPDRTLLVGLTTVSFPLYLTPLLLTTGAYKRLPFNPQMLAISGELVREVFLHLQVMPAFSRWVQLCPKGMEGTIMSLLVSTLNISRAINKMSSAAAAAAFGVTASNFSHLSVLVLFCGAFCLLPLPLATMIPDGASTHPLAIEIEGHSDDEEEGEEQDGAGLQLRSQRAYEQPPVARPGDFYEYDATRIAPAG